MQQKRSRQGLIFRGTPRLRDIERSDEHKRASTTYTSKGGNSANLIYPLSNSNPSVNMSSRNHYGDEVQVCIARKKIITVATKTDIGSFE